MRLGAMGNLVRAIRSLGGAASLVVAVLFSTVAEARDFYAVSAGELAGPPGSLIRFEGMPEVALSRAMVYRILYRSRDMRGDPVAVSGMAIVPFGPPPPEGRPVVAWAHGTTGIVPKCAPSLLPHPLKAIAGVNELVAGGYIVAATDYPGLGTGSIHPYLVGLSEGRAVLDAARAVRDLPGSRPGGRLALFGYSQGGHAALWAGQIQRSYAPEFDLVGVAALAPATELGKLFTDDIDRLSGRILSALVIGSWSSPEVYGAPLGRILSPAVQPEILDVSRDCIDLVGGELRDLKLNKRIPADFLIASPTRVAPWDSLIAANRPSTRSIGVPFYVAQGTADTIVDPPVTKDFVRRMCASGTPVKLEMFPGKTHHNLPKAAGRSAVDWIGDRFRGDPVPDSC